MIALADRGLRHLASLAEMARDPELVLAGLFPVLAWRIEKTDRGDGFFD